MVLAAGALTAFAQSQPAEWTAVVEGYRAALQKRGIVGSRLMVVRDGQIASTAAGVGVIFYPCRNSRSRLAATRAR